MKLLFLLFLVAIIGTVVYLSSRKQIRITAIVVVILLGLIAFGMYKSATAPDIKCNSYDKAPHPSISLKTAMDYYNLGNMDYDLGNCHQAIIDYTRSIELDPNYPQAYNNRAYTNMRLRNYAGALKDLDKAIDLKPDYVQALMNRGDIHNYYYQIDRKAAIADYDKVISLGKSLDLSSSVCGHKAMAETNNFIPLVFLKFIFASEC